MYVAAGGSAKDSVLIILEKKKWLFILVLATLYMPRNEKEPI